jgi:hypothetical protein
MAYGSDITEGLPYRLSNPAGATTYSANAEAYDIAINSMAFFLNTGDEFPYRRETAQYRKQQIDQSSEPGEQSITGWWVRAQSSFHSGSGVKFYDPSSGETIPYRFTDSKGVNVWEKGKVTLLKNVTQGHETTGAIDSNGVVQQHMRSIKWSTFTGALLHDGYDVDKIKVTDPSNPVHFIDYNAGAGVYPVYAICDDGTNAYWITNKLSGGTTKLTAYGKPLTGDSTSAADEFKIFDNSQIITNGVIEYVKQRLVICADNKVYECQPLVSSTPTLVYTHPSTTHVYTSITASGPAIYISGYNGSQSTIEKYTLASNGSMPVLTSAQVAAEMPEGEIIHKIYYYLGYMMIGTNRGVRAARVSDQDGSIGYGPLIVETSQPCYDFAARDRFVWCATSVDGAPGLIRIDLDNEIETLRFAYANDVYYASGTGHQTTACCFDGNTDPSTADRLMFATAYASSANGAVYVEDASTLMASGYITTGKIRYSTLENKIFKILKTLASNEKGRVVIKSVDSNENEYVLGTFTQGGLTPEVNVSYPAGAQEYLSFKFELSRSSTVNTEGPILSGYQLKALPAVGRQRLISYPLACYDRENDSFGNQVGHEGAAYEKLALLEDIESVGDTIRVEDFRTGESFLGIIEQLQFINRTPTDKRFSGFGGVLLATIRTI